MKQELIPRRLSLALIAALGAAPAIAGADTIAGQASVIDADTIEIHGARIRLANIDAPESAQTCFTNQGEAWRCGQKAAFALADQIGRATVECNIIGQDRYRRHLAHCWANGLDLNGWLIREGWALRYYDGEGRYAGEELEAEARGNGVWSGTFDHPADWRRAHR